MRHALSPSRLAAAALAVTIEVAVDPPFVPRRIRPRYLWRSVEPRARSVTNRMLDRIDVTQLIIDHVSVQRLLDSADLAAIADQVLRDVDLTDLVRSSTGTLAADGVVGVRVQAASADDAVDRVVARLIPGRRRIVDAFGR